MLWRFTELVSDGKINGYWRDNRWDLLALASFPLEIVAAAAESFFCFGTGPNKPVWTLEPSGGFSIKSAYQLVRTARAQVWTYACI